MKRIALVTLFVLGVIALGVGTVGCFAPPQKTVWWDTTGDGEPDILAVDADMDGRPDVDAAGNPILALSPEELAKYRALLVADKYGPEVLATGGVLFGIPLLAAIGGIWKSVKFGRVLTNMILSIQQARSTLKKYGPAGSLEVLDGALSDAQVQGTKDAIVAVKDKLGLGSVTATEPPA